MAIWKEVLQRTYDKTSRALKVKGDIKLTGSRVEEVLTQDNASLDNVLTFEEPIQSIEIWHDEDDPKEFIVNGITLVIASGGWRSPVGGTPSDEVTIPAGITCIVKRLV